MPCPEEIKTTHPPAGSFWNGTPIRRYSCDHSKKTNKLVPAAATLVCRAETKGIAIMGNLAVAQMEITSDNVTPANADKADIAALAYQLWNERGCPVGSPDEDWFRAEQQLKGQSSAAAA